MKASTADKLSLLIPILIVFIFLLSTGTLYQLADDMLKSPNESINPNNSAENESSNKPLTHRKYINLSDINYTQEHVLANITKGNYSVARLNNTSRKIVVDQYNKTVLENGSIHNKTTNSVVATIENATIIQKDENIPESGEAHYERDGGAGATPIHSVILFLLAVVFYPMYRMTRYILFKNFVETDSQ